jgi:hypothetical protein
MKFESRVSITMHSIGFGLLSLFFVREGHEDLGELAFRCAFWVVLYAWFLEPLLSKLIIPWVRK